MSSINADWVRIPREVREAVARRERVTIYNREHAVAVLVHPDDVSGPHPGPVGRRLRDIIADLGGVPSPDAGFADDLDEVRRHVGDTPTDPWE